jgi:hypothetical protein
MHVVSILPLDAEEVLISDVRSGMRPESFVEGKLWRALGAADEDGFGHKDSVPQCADADGRCRKPR